MEFIGAVVAIIVILMGMAFLIKHQRSIGYWISTPHYNKEYKIRMLKRQIEDAQIELERLESPND